MDSEFVIKELIGKSGFYCKISVTVLITSSKSLNLNYNQESQWYSAVLFASEYFYEDYISYNPSGGLDIKINEIHGHAIDTTNMVVLYATLMALYKAVKIHKGGVFIDEYGILHLPK